MSRFNRLELPDEANSPPVLGDAKSASASTSPTADEKRYKNRPQDWMNDADVHRRRGHYETALRSYGRALECHRSFAPAWVGQAQMLVLLGEPRQAEMWVMSGLKVFPDNADLIAARAQAIVRLGKPTEAIQYSDAAIQGEGNSAYRWQVRGEIMIAKRSTNADHCFDSAEQLDPDWLVKTENANICRFHNVPLKGLRRASAAVAAAIDAPWAWVVQGICQHESGFTAEAIKSFQQAINLAPDFGEARDWLATAQNNGGFFSRVWRRLFRR
ncbi:MAG: tetratricopeptide repeat protein [Thermoguttaceae bacterium]